MFRWSRSTDLEQRNGRIVRQGNSFKDVGIYNYVTEGTFDAYMMNIIVTKQKFISQLMSGKTPARTCEDVDELVLNYSEMQALASGDPRIKEKIELDGEVSRLRLLESEHYNKKYALEDMVHKCELNISSSKQMLSSAMSDKKYAEAHQLPEGEFAIKIGGTLFSERKEAGEKLQKEILSFLARKETTVIGEYRGFSVSITPGGLLGSTPFIELRRNDGERGLTYSAELELKNDVGNIMRLENCIKNGIEKRITELEQTIAGSEINLQEALATKDLPFEFADELAEKTTRLEQLNAELNVDKPDEVMMNDDEHDNEIQAPEQHQKRNGMKH